MSGRLCASLTINICHANLKALGTATQLWMFVRLSIVGHNVRQCIGVNHAVGSCHLRVTGMTTCDEVNSPRVQRLPSRNQRLQWKIHHLQMIFPCQCPSRGIPYSQVVCLIFRSFKTSSSSGTRPLQVP